MRILEERLRARDGGVLGSYNLYKGESIQVSIIFIANAY